MIKAVAIDDELPALKVIENFCNKVDFIQLDKTFNQPNEGLKYVNKFPVDLLFLDINMPSISGTDLVPLLKQKTLIIFTTAYSEYALEGFNLNAIDYLLKPFTFERFVQAVNKSKEYFDLTTKSAAASEQYIYIRADYSLIKINLADILFIEGLDDYLKIHVKNQKTVVARMTMKAMTEKLPSDIFVRVHRSYIVSVKHVESIRNRIITIAGDEIPVGNSYEENFLTIFNK